MTHRKSAGFQQVGSLLREVHPELIISKRRLRKVESIECVRLKREKARQNLGFSSRPFVLCGLPVRRPPEGSLLHERRNGQFILQVIGHPGYGLPWGQTSSSRFSWRLRLSGRSRRRSCLKARPRCSTPSECSRAVHNTAA